MDIITNFGKRLNIRRWDDIPGLASCYYRDVLVCNLEDDPSDITNLMDNESINTSTTVIDNMLNGDIFSYVMNNTFANFISNVYELIFNNYGLGIEASNELIFECLYMENTEEIQTTIYIGKLKIIAYNMGDYRIFVFCLGEKQSMHIKLGNNNFNNNLCDLLVRDVLCN